MFSVSGCVQSCANAHYGEQMQNRYLFVWLETTAATLQLNNRKGNLEEVAQPCSKISLYCPEHLENYFPLLYISEPKRHGFKVTGLQVEETS